MTTDPTIAALELFQRAHDLHGPARERFLRDQCGPDVALFERVSEMLRADARSHAFLDHALSAEAPRRPPARVEGRQLGPYRLVRELGRGGMGVVYLAERDDVGRRVALKLITSHSASAEGIARFHYERRVLASLEHPYIARFLDAGIAEDETPWLAMEYVEGQALDAWCRTRELPVADRVALVEKVCEAVAYVHRNLLVHRDLKPSNILITGEGEPRLVDFGIAKLLADEVPGQRTLPEAAGRPMTPEYASPEQLRGDRITPASDVYQLGLVLQELLRDRRIRGDLANILAMALAPEPERRYASADQLREDIRAHREGRPVVARPGSIAYRARKFVQRHKAAVGMLVTLNVVLVASALLLANQARRIARERDRAEQVSTVLERLVRFADPTASGPDSGSARAVLAEAASEARAGLARDSRTWGRILVSIADVYRNAGQNDTAVALLREAVTALRATVPADDPALLDGVNSLGVMFVMTGAVDSGLALLEQVVTHARRLDPRRREELASHLIDLGFGRQVAGDDRRAFELYAEAMPVLETLPDSGAVIYDRALINLGFMSERAGEDSAAAARFRLALDRRLARHGPESGPTLNAMTSYARAQLRLGNLEEAERWSDRALETRRRMLPDPHQNLAESLLLSSQIHAARNRLALADSTGHLALSMYRRLPAASAMTLGWSLATLAGILSREGKYAEAGGMLREALQAYRSVVGDLHPSTLLTMTSLAENELWLGNPRVALELIERAVPPLDSIWGDRATLAAPLTTWGIALADLGRCAEALPHLERAARLARARWADTSLAVTVPERYLQRCGGRAG